MTTYTEAIDSVYGIVRTNVQSSVAIFGYVPEILWEGLELDKLPDRSKFWLRVSQRMTSQRQATFRNGLEGQRFTNKSTLYVQIFCPFTTAQAVTKGRELAILVRKAFTGKQTTDGVWFRNPRILEAPPDKDWLPITFSIEFTFDEVI